MSSLRMTSAGPVEQVFALSNSDSVTIIPPGQEAPLPGTTLEIQLHHRSLLIVSFDARVFGLTSESGKTNGPFLELNCHFDGQHCEPNGNGVEHYALAGFGHAQSFTWVVHSAKTGPHKIEILATAINFGSLPGLIEEVVITNRTLVVTAARLDAHPAESAVSH